MNLLNCDQMEYFRYKVADPSLILVTLGFPIFYIGSKFGAIGLASSFVIAAYIHMTYHWIVFKKLLAPYLTLRLLYKT